MRVEPDLVQTNILRSVDPAFSFFVFFRINDVAAFRLFLASALDKSLNFAGVQTGIYSERDRLPHRRRSIENVATATGPPSESHSLHMNVGFTLSGLEALGVEEETRKSFPEPFREGMAARAAILGDDGVSVPDHWDGYLGSREVHGVLWWNWWDVCREDRLPGEAHSKLEKQAHSTWDQIKKLIPDHGIELLHSETGAANYQRFASGEIDRVEHFGFRDGISQPWIDFAISDSINLSHPAPGGGTPRQNGHWAPLAPGEFVLGYPDEDGLIQPWPCNPDLQRAGMYMVFRKLEQDVMAFRNYLRSVSADEPSSQLLAAQMFGRWPDGTSLVQSPEGPNECDSRDPTRRINDFRYERDDPHGMRCPIGSHVRRANPRDTGGQNEARRHRLLRRGITYGGSMLPQDSRGDGRKRGVLFVALNARIDQQFEFIQSRWLNAGELLGQVGAGQDPISAPNDGRVSDSFWSSARPAPVTNLARFVTMRGGDYFFVPGLGALGGLAKGEVFAASPETQSLRETSIGKLETPDPFDPDTLFELGRAELLPSNSSPYCSWLFRNFLEHPGATPRDYAIVFIGRHQHVLNILHDERRFSVRPYKAAIARITGGENMIVGMDSREPDHNLRISIWDNAVQAYKGQPLEEIIERAVTEILVRCSPSGRLDVVQDIGRIIPLVVAQSYYGVPGPDWLSPTAVAVSFNKLSISDVPRSWLGRPPPVQPQDIPFVSLQAWTRFAFAQVFVNPVQASDLIAVAQRTTAELFGHLDSLIAKEYLLKPNEKTLLGCMVQKGCTAYGLTFDEFNKQIRLILAERIVGGTDTLNKAIVNVINHLLDHRDRMERAKAAARKLRIVQREAQASVQPSPGARDAMEARDEMDAVIRECLRFDPVAPMLFRHCEEDTIIEGELIKQNTLVCLLAKTAMFDASVFRKPDEFIVSGPDRPAKDYLTFGIDPHQCRGQKMAQAILRIVLSRLVLLRDLHRAAGPIGEIQNMLGLPLPDSMVVRFDPRLPGPSIPMS